MNSLVIHNLGEVEVLLEPGAFERRDTLLATAKEVQKVTDDFTKGLAVEAWQDLAGLSKGLEKTRVEIKAPVLALGRRIDDMARAFIQPVDAEVARINRLVTTYNAQQERARHEAERARQAEIDRLAREKQAAELAQRQAAETAQVAFDATERKQAEAEAAAQQQRQADLRQQQQAIRQTVVVAPVKQQGEVIKKVWTFEVTNLEVLVKNHFELCRVDPNKAAINALLATGIREIPGLRIFETIKTEVRS